MLEIKGFNRDLLKEELKSAYNLRTEASSKIEKRYKGTLQYDKMNRELNQNQFLRDLYSIGKTVPIKVEGLIINYKLFKAFVKNLRGHQTEIFIEDEFLVLEYRNGRSKGQLELRDISRYFKGFKHIPVAEVQR